MKLDEYQQKVVNLTIPPDAALRVVANAGSGKSTTMLCKVQALIKQGVDPNQIVIFSFSRQARLDLQRKWSVWADPNQDMPVISTIHSFGLYVLRHYLKVKAFSLVKPVEQMRLIKQVCPPLPVPSKNLAGEYYSIQNLISFYKAHCVPVDSIDPEGDYPLDFYGKTPTLEFKDFHKLYQDYENLMRESSYYDYDDLIAQPYYLLSKRLDVLAKIRQKHGIYVVDESQDLNVANWNFIMLLSSGLRLIAVGDPCQNIYTFRYAKPENFSRAYFKRFFSKVRTLELPYNYRSSKDIVEFGNIVRRLNRDELMALAVKSEDPFSVRIYKEAKASNEGQLVVKIVKELLTKYQLSDITVISRTTSFINMALERHFIEAKLPYRILAARSRSFHETSAAQIYTNLLALLVNPKNWVAFTSLVPFLQGMGEYRMGLKNQESMGKTAKTYIDLILKYKKATVTVQKKTDELVHEYYFEILKLSKNLNFMDPFVVLTNLRKLNDEFLKEKFKLTDKQFDRVSRVLLSFINDYLERSRNTNLRDAMQEAVLNLTEYDVKDDDPNRITLSTVHAQKGLESKVSIVCGFRTYSAMTDLGDEGNILYVQVSRAIEKLIIIRSSYIQKQDRSITTGVENAQLVAVLNEAELT